MYWTTRIAYVAIVALATLTNLHLSGDMSAAVYRLARSIDPSVGWSDAVDGIRNVALFAGLGAVWVATAMSGLLRVEVKKAVLVGFALSAIVEGTQVFSPSRTASILDLMTNTAGAFIGAFAVAGLIADAARARGEKSYVGVPALMLSGAYVLATLCEAMTPLFSADQVPDIPGGPIAWWHEAMRASLPLSISHITFSDILLFVPAGFLVVMMLAERGLAARWVRVAAIGSALMFLVEILHGLIRLHIWWEAAVWHAAAWSFGAWAAHRWLAAMSRELRGAERARFAIVAYAMILFCWGWRPFLPETHGSLIAAQFSMDHFVPLRALAIRMDVFSALHVAQQFFLYFPLGALLAVWPLRFRGAWSHLWSGVWLAAAIELGHVVVEGRFFDITNFMIACAGLGMGWLLVRRVGFRPYGQALPPAPASAKR